jgi:hypothetical protein
MHEGTNFLINHRQKFSESTVKVVKVKNVGGGNANECLNNAFNQIDTEKSIKIASGWIVGKTDKATHSTFILQHYWNADAEGNYFDTTPLAKHFIYVLDVEMMNYSQKHFRILRSSVSRSLLLKNGVFFTFSSTDENEPFIEIRSLHPKNLFQLK